MKQGIIFGALAGACWGFIFLPPVLLPEISPLLLTCGRFATYGILAAILLIPQWRNIARAQILLGEFESAEIVLEELNENARSLRLMSDLNRNLLLLNQLYWQAGRKSDAQRVLLDALKLANRTGFISHFVIEGEAMAQQLRQLIQLNTLPERDIVLLHPCCHNPTGADLTPAQWDSVIEILKARELIPFLDIAYQGFGGGIEDDAYAIRAIASAGLPALVSNSFSKIFSLYGERVGGLSVVCEDGDTASRVLGQLKATVRRNYSSPPNFGAQVVATVLGDDRLKASWLAEVEAMRKRILSMRQELVNVLKEAVPGHNFDYLLKQRGMFSYTGLSAAQVDRLREEFGVYLIASGRMCVAGLNASNVHRVAQAFAAVM